MSKKLENFMSEHREDFDIYEPKGELWEKIDARLGKKPTSYLSLIWKAAVILVVFGFSFWVQKHRESIQEVREVSQINSKDTALILIPATQERKITAQQEKKKEMVGLPTVGKMAQAKARSPHKEVHDYAETENYYNQQVNNSIKELKVVLVSYPDVAYDMHKEMAELDSVYRQLKHDLGDNAAHQEIIDAMIQNYRMKLKILNDIKQALIDNSAIKTSSNNSSHEI